MQLLSLLFAVNIEVISGGEKSKRSGVHVNSRPSDEQRETRISLYAVCCSFFDSATPAIAGKLEVDLAAGRDLHTEVMT